MCPYRGKVASAVAATAAAAAASAAVRPLAGTVNVELYYSRSLMVGWGCFFEGPSQPVKNQCCLLWFAATCDM